MNSVSCCSHKYLGRLARVEKRECVLLLPLLDFKEQGSQSSTLPPERGQEKKSNVFRDYLEGNRKKTQSFTDFNTIFRGVKRMLYPIAMLQGVECMHLC